MKKTEIEQELELMEREKLKFDKEIEIEKTKFIQQIKTVGKEKITGKVEKKKLSFFDKLIKTLYGKTR